MCVTFRPILRPTRLYIGPYLCGLMWVHINVIYAGSSVSSCPVKQELHRIRQLVCSWMYIHCTIQMHCSDQSRWFFALERASFGAELVPIVTLWLVLCSSKNCFGVVHKVRHARGEGVRESVTVCDRGRGIKSMWRHAYNFFFIHMKHKIESDV